MKKLLINATILFCTIAMVACTTTNNSSTTMTTQAVLDNIMTRVSVRQFTGEPITDEQVETLLRAAMAAPSAINSQPWAFMVINDVNTLAAIGEKFPNSRCQNNPAVAIVMCGDMDKALPGVNRDFWIDDVSAATENLLLAAHAMGLGAVWTGVHPNMERVTLLQELLGLPQTIIPLCVVPVGHPAENPAVKDKFKAENIHYNVW